MLNKSYKKLYEILKGRRDEGDELTPYETAFIELYDTIVQLEAENARLRKFRCGTCNHTAGDGHANFCSKYHQELDTRRKEKQTLESEE